MIKVFKTDSKVNIVDDTNVFVGYDTSQHCCETADYWFFEQEPKGGIYKPAETQNDHLIEGYPYVFDISYFKEQKYDNYGEIENTAIFRLIDDKNEFPDVYLVLYNCHNGYYSHGFEFGKGERTKIKTGFL